VKFIPGIYRHWKGGLYVALCVARSHEDEGEPEVIYYSEVMKHWNRRPLSSFQEEVSLERAREYQEECGGEVYKGPRFKLVASLDHGVLNRAQGVGLLGATYALLGDAMASLGL